MNEPSTAAVVITRSGGGQPFAPPGHVGVNAAILHGPTDGGPSNVRVLLSRYAPGARAELAPTQADTVYVVVEGVLQLHVPGHGSATDLETGDSVFLSAGTERQLVNASGHPAAIIVVLSLPPHDVDEPSPR